MTLFKVQLRREQQAEIFVECNTAKEAEETAWELQTNFDWEDMETEEQVSATKEIPYRFWSGGEEGTWVFP